SIKLEHGQQFDRGDAQLLQIWNLLYKTCKGAAALFWHRGAWMAREAAHVHLINNRARGRALQGSVTFPIIGVHIYDHALHGGCRVIPGLPCGVATIVPGNTSAAPVWIQQDFAWIETHSSRRIESSLNAITVNLPCFYLRNKDMPIMIGTVSCRIDRDHTRRLNVVDTIKKKEFDASRMF